MKSIKKKKNTGALTPHASQLWIVLRRTAESFGRETVSSSFCSHHAPTNHSDLTGNTNKVIRSHQAAGVNRSLHTGCCHQLYFIHHTHEHAARAALHVRSGLKRGREISLEVSHTALGRHVRWHESKMKIFQEMMMSLNDIIINNEEFLFAHLHRCCAPSKIVLLQTLPASFLLPSCSGGGLSTDRLKKHLS